MRNFFFLLALLFPVITFAQQPIYAIEEIEPTNYLITYSLLWQEDSTNANFIRQEDMLLFIGKETSKFTSLNDFSFDTIMRKVTTREEIQRMLSDLQNPLPFGAFNYQIFKQYPKEKLICIDHTLDGTFRYEEELSLFNWQLSGDTATIAGYKAQKATTNFGGRSWVAWFSADLPFNDGPYKFNGLPGLIVKVHDTRNHYVFELISVEKPAKELMIDYKIKAFIDTSKGKFFESKERLRTNIIDRVKKAGGDHKSQQRAASNMAKRNNPIELKW